jgi:hypothetical protein
MQKKYKSVNVFETDTDVVPRGQNFSVYTAIKPHADIVKKYYCVLFENFVLNARGPMLSVLQQHALDLDKKFVSTTEKLIKSSLLELLDIKMKAFNETENKIKVEDEEYIQSIIDKANSSPDPNSKLSVNEQIKKFKSRGEQRANDRIKELENEKDTLIGNFAAKLNHVLREECTRQFKDSIAPFIYSHFRLFLESEQGNINKKFLEEQDKMASPLMKFWGCFKDKKEARHFCETIIAKRSTGKMGNTFIQENGVWGIFNPVKESNLSVYFNDKKLDEAMSAYKKRMEIASEDLKQRQIILQEQFAREEDIKYESFVKKDGKYESNAENRENLLKDVSNEELDLMFSRINPRFQLEAKLDTVERRKNKEKLENLIKKTIQTEKITKEGLVDINMMDRMKADRGDTLQMEINKKIRRGREKRDLDNKTIAKELLKENLKPVDYEDIIGQTSYKQILKQEKDLKNQQKRNILDKFTSKNI